MQFYGRTMGAKQTMLMRFGESPEARPPGMVPPGSENKVMHASFRIGDTEVLASDGNCHGRPKFEGVSLSLTLSNVTEADRVFAALAEGGQVQMPLTETFFAPRFGMVADRFGVSWMIVVGK